MPIILYHLQGCVMFGMSVAGGQTQKNQKYDSGCTPPPFKLIIKMAPLKRGQMYSKIFALIYSDALIGLEPIALQWNSAQPTSRYNRHALFGPQECFSFILTSPHPTTRYNRHDFRGPLQCWLCRVPLYLESVPR